jgi:CubicO group peptidase (beta-lactamase class C family)
MQLVGTAPSAGYVPSVSLARIDHRRTALIAAYRFQSPGRPAIKTTLSNIASMIKPISTEVVPRFQRAPGKAFAYSGEGFECLVRFVEKRTGEPFECLAQRMVFDPIGMRDSAYIGLPRFTRRIAAPADAEGNPLVPQIADTYFPSGDVYATVGDCARFLVGLMRREGVGRATAAVENHYAE